MTGKESAIDVDREIDIDDKQINLYVGTLNKPRINNIPVAINTHLGPRSWSLTILLQ